MSNDWKVIKKLDYEITEDEFTLLQKKHQYIGEKLIVDAINGIKVVAKDMNEVAKNHEKFGGRVWDSITGSGKKRQNQINENVIVGLKSVSQWLQDHDGHLTRIDWRIKDVADELYKTQDEILKFYSQFKEVDFRVELLEEFKKSAERRFENIEERLKKIESQQQIDREVSKLGHLNLPIEIEIFTILDNLASGEFGLWMMSEKESKKKEEQTTYLKRKIIEKLKIEGKEYLDFKKLSSSMHKLNPIEKNTIELISKQYQSFEDEKSYEIIDLIALSATNKPEAVEQVIDEQSHIRTFMTYNDYVDVMAEELFNINIYKNISPIVEKTDDTHEELQSTKTINNNDKNILNHRTKLGVVLSGGGAKGAYEAGFLKALAEFNVQPQAIAGTSIGALNGAIYSAKRETKTSAKLIRELWQELGSDGVLEIDKTKAVKNLIEVFSYFTPMPVSRLSKVAMALTKAGKSNEGILTQLPIVNRLEQHAPVNELKVGLPFYVGLTKTQGNIQDVINFAGFGNEEASFKKVQSLSENDMHKAIMASAALPLLFDGLEVEGEVYRDGCLGSTDNEWGNTPAKPLVTNEGCTHLIVCHLGNGSFFNRYDPLFKDITIIEIRPESGTFNSELDALRFNVEKIDLWMKQGYKDTKRTLADTFEAINGVRQRVVSEVQADKAVERLKNRTFKLGE